MKQVDIKRKPSILIIDSIRDSITCQRRIKIFESQEIRQAYEIAYMYLVEPEDYLLVVSKPESLFREIVAFGDWLPHRDLRHKIYLRALAEMHPNIPDYILFYTGCTFFQFQCQLFYSLLRLKHRFPGTIIAGFNTGKRVEIPCEEGPLEPLEEYEKKAIYDITWHHEKSILFDAPIGLLDSSPTTNAICYHLAKNMSGERQTQPPAGREHCSSPAGRNEEDINSWSAF